MNASADIPPGWSFPSTHTFVHRPTAKYRKQIRFSLEKLSRFAISPQFQAMDGFLADDVSDDEIDIAYDELFCEYGHPASPDYIAWALYGRIAAGLRKQAGSKLDQGLDERRAG
ncbi:hypothetical protein ABZ942_04785 [Nocardia sp. NPDC046473]|uniref:hypothetical protein n=1 Tax=Nocardia sp. NPDC046473 TaxID=3155733 RepID=UPI0033F1D513